jgi:hypothetical protein
VAGERDIELPAEELRWRERRIIDIFKMYARRDLSFGTSDWDVLLLGQHYRLPTRLLDWTSSPYVALYFATEDPTKDEKDGIVYCVQRVETNKALPEVFAEMLRAQGTNLFSLETLKGKFQSVEEFDTSPTNALLWLEPPSVSDRIVNQYAFFSIIPGVDTRHCDWLERHSEWHWAVTVPACLKCEVRQRLQVMNITERTMYPGLEGIAKWLKSYHGAPNPSPQADAPPEGGAVG